MKAIGLAMMSLTLITAGETPNSATSQVPNGQLEVVERMAEDAQYRPFVIAVRGKDGKSVDVWRSNRPSTWLWSPKGGYLAIQDPVARACRAVLVFRINQNPLSAKLMYQTPFSNSERDLSFVVAEWSDEGTLKIDITSRRRKVYTMEKDTKVSPLDIEQNIYDTKR